MLWQNCWCPALHDIFITGTVAVCPPWNASPANFGTLIQ